jgi:hypothetical protein
MSRMLMRKCDGLAGKGPVGSRSLCLVDAMVVIDGARYGYLDRLCRVHRIGIGALMCQSVRYWRDEMGVAHLIDLEALVADGSIKAPPGNNVYEQP